MGTFLYSVSQMHEKNKTYTLQSVFSGKCKPGDQRLNELSMQFPNIDQKKNLPKLSNYHPKGNSLTISVHFEKFQLIEENCCHCCYRWKLKSKTFPHRVSHYTTANIILQKVLNESGSCLSKSKFRVISGCIHFTKKHQTYFWTERTKTVNFTPTFLSFPVPASTGVHWLKLQAKNFPRKLFKFCKLKKKQHWILESPRGSE